MDRPGFVVREGDHFLIDERQRRFGLLIDTIILSFLEGTFARGGGGSLLDAGAGTQPYFSVYKDYFLANYHFDLPYSFHDITWVDVLASAEVLPLREEQFYC